MPLRHTLLAALIATSALSGAAVPAMAREGEASLEQRFATPPRTRARASAGGGRAAR